MRPAGTAWIVASLLVLGTVPLGAQAPTKAGTPASAGPIVVAPAKPQVAPRINPKGDSGPLPTAARSANARTISLSARQAAEQTIAALAAAMKNLPKRPP